MPQVHCYLNDTLNKRLQEKAKQNHISVSKYIAGLIERDVGNQWPEGYFELAGAWQGDFELPDEGEFEVRESFD